MAKMYYEKDCDLNKLTGKTVAVIGYGSQGHAHALNLRDSGVDVIVGLRKGGKSWPVAVKDGFDVMTVPEAAQKADIIMILINDERQADMYKQDIAPYLTEGKAIAFAHGFNIRYKQIVPPAGVDVFMAAPKGPGHTVRSTYVVGKGVPCLVAVEQDASGHCLDTALAYIAGIGGARAGIMETTMHDETETDLFGEQAVLCGGIVELMRCGFETLVEAGYEPENAYFECIHEMKLIVDLINKGGVAAMNYSISDTAEYGEYVSGPRILPYEQTKANMKAVLNDIQDGTFAGKWIAENKNGRCFFNSHRDALAKHPMEVIGKQLREQISGSPMLSEMIERGRLKILALYPDEDLTEWRNYRDHIPATWINAYDAGCLVRENGTYDLTAIPSLYLLDSDKRVLVKDCTDVPYIEEVIDRRG
mgnify:CR=1 FL=1